MEVKLVFLAFFVVMIALVQAVGGDTSSATCIPFVSEYTDCTDDNRCTGCSKCRCNATSQWECEAVTDCLDSSSFELDENSVDKAWQSIEGAWKKNQAETTGQTKTPLVPRPTGSENDILLEEIANLDKVEADEDEELINRDLLGMLRRKRSVQLSTENSNDTVKFHHTIDEINEDTLKNNDTIGTLQANKFAPNLLTQVSRRTGVFDVTNNSNPLHIEYKSPLYDHHIADNKIDTASHSDAYDLLDRQEFSRIVGNQTQQNKDKTLSKLIVNELKKGLEVVGDANAPSISNITFRPENDTLTAMAFIAGNLLNKLWNMEKDERDASIETDMLKHEKIADLLELFKEPLTIRQENFLKNALDHLSEAINGNKDASNISLCKKVEVLKGLNDTAQEKISKHENCKEDKNVTNMLNLKNTEDAIAKIKDVLGLITKYETVQRNISNLKDASPLRTSKNDQLIERSGENSSNQFLTKDESTSLNLFGNVLRKITKLLVPKRNSKKIINSLNNQNVLLKSDDLKTKLKRIYNIDLENTTLSTKDKVILDYLSNLRMNGNCQLNRDKFHDIPSIEGGILLNLSEFFKIKSFIDLLKLLETEKPIARIATLNKLPSTESRVTRITQSTTTISPVKIDPVNKLSKTKENLKAHLKIIINDLLELKNDSNIKIADALPCIYNLLNADRNLTNITNTNLEKASQDNVRKMFELIKKDMKYSTETRRTFFGAQKRPKSAVVWERIIKNLDNRQQLHTRRYLKTKSFEEVNKMIDDLESTSDTYKNDVLIKEVSPNKRLVLLKALDINVKQYINILEEFKSYMNSMLNVPSEKKTEINEFVNNANKNIKLNERIMNTLKKPKQVEQLLTNIPNYKISESKLRTREDLILESSIDDKSKPRSKLMREEIINQLIKNRIQYYLKVKDARGSNDLDNDMNVRIAKKILRYLNSSNNILARELYKIFVSRKQQTTFDAGLYPKSQTTQRNSLMAVKEPLIQFENRRSLSDQRKPVTQEMLLKQLLNIKNMK